MTSRASILPVAAVAFGIAVFSLMDAAMKSASISTGVYTALLLRGAFGVVLMLPLWLVRERRRPAPRVLALHAMRAATVAVMALLFFWGLVRIPMNEGVAISFIAPLIALYLAAVVLGERIRRSAVAGSALGLAGVVVITIARIGGSGTAEANSSAGVAALLASAVLYAVNLVIQRRQAQLAGPIEVALFQAAGIALVLLPTLPWFGQLPTAPALRDVALSAVLSSVSLVLFAWAYARAEAQVLLSMEYTAFVWAALFGWLWFGEGVGAAALAGTVLIVAGCWIAVRPSATAPTATLVGPPPAT